MKKLGISRIRALYEQIEPIRRLAKGGEALPATALRPRAVEAVPPQHRATGCHVVVERHAYSVPFCCSSSASRSRSATPRATVEVFFKGRRVSVAPAPLRRTAVHRARAHARAPTAPMPSGHRRASSAGPRRSVRQPASSSLEVLESRPHPEQGYKAVLGIMRLGRSARQRPARRRERPRHGPRFLPFPRPSRTSSPPARTVCPWSRRPRRPRRPRTPTSAAPTTTPRPTRRTDADRTDPRDKLNAMRELGAMAERLPATDPDRRGHRAQLRTGFAPARRRRVDGPRAAQTAAAAPHRQAAPSGLPSRPSTSPTRAGSTANRS